MRKKILLVLLIAFLAVLVTRPFLNPGYFETDDGLWAVVRQGAMHRAIIAGQFPVRWAGNLNFGYGYPLFLFAYPLPYYLGEFFYLLGFGLVGSVKLLFILSVILSGTGMFFLGSKLFGKWGGLVAAVFYLYAPYRLVNLYQRGSLGESLALVFYPLLFLAVIKIFEGSKIWLSMGSILLAGLLTVHNVSALLFIPFLFAYLAFLTLASTKRTYHLSRITCFVLFGFGLASFFWLPALLEKKHVVLSQTDLANVSDYFVSLKELVTSGGQKGFARVGVIHLAAWLLALTSWLIQGKKADKTFAIFSLMFLILTFLMTPASGWFWKNLPLLSEVDFPFRSLGPGIFFLSISLGSLVGKKLWRFLAIGLSLLLIFLNLSSAPMVKSLNLSDSYYLTNEATTTSADEFLPLWVAQKPAERAKDMVVVESGRAEVTNLLYDSKKIRLDLTAQTESKVLIGHHYFPGWQLTLNQESAPIDYLQNGGLMGFSVPPGQISVLLKFGETSLRLVADLISLISLVGIFLVAIIGLRSRHPRGGATRHPRGETGFSPTPTR